LLQLFRKRLSNQKGFTLVELLVVISIIGILASIAVPKFASANETARGAKVLADLRTIDSASQIHYAQKGTYPATVADLVNANLLAANPVALNTGEAFTINGHSYTAANGYTIEQGTPAAGTTPATAATGRALYDSKTADKFINP